jgi:hypothetical protein
MAVLATDCDLRKVMPQTLLQYGSSRSLGGVK